MKYSEAIEKIKSLEGGEDLASAILSEVQKKGEGEASLRQKLKAFDGVDVEKYKKISGVVEALDGVGIDLDGDIAEQVSSLKKKTESGSAESEALKAQLKKLQKRVDDSDRARVEAENKSNQKAVEAAFAGKFAEKVFNPTDTLRYRMSQGEFTMQDGKVGYMDNGVFVSEVEGAFDRFIANNPSIVKNTQKPGAGGGSGEPNGGSKFTFESIKKLTPADYRKFTPEQVAEIGKVVAAGPQS